jgi:hypothetical protein
MTSTTKWIKQTSDILRYVNQIQTRILETSTTPTNAQLLHREWMEKGSTELREQLEAYTQQTGIDMGFTHALIDLYLRWNAFPSRRKTQLHNLAPATNSADSLATECRASNAGQRLPVPTTEICIQQGIISAQTQNHSGMAPPAFMEQSQELTPTQSGITLLVMIFGILIEAPPKHTTALTTDKVAMQYSHRRLTFKPHTRYFIILLPPAPVPRAGIG